MTILSNSKIVLGNVPGFSVNKMDKSYMLTQFWERGWVKNNAKIAKQILKRMFFMQASIFVMRCLNKKKFFVSLSIFCDIILVHIKQNS